MYILPLPLYSIIEKGKSRNRRKEENVYWWKSMKTIKVSEELYWKLAELKVKLRVRSFEQVLVQLLEGDNLKRE